MNNPASMHSPTPDPSGVVVTGGTTANALGIIRSFGRRGIPVVYIDSDKGSFVRHSRYINRCLTCDKTNYSESDLISLLKDFSKRQDRKMMIIPVGDEAVLALSKHREELETFYHVPVPEHETVQKLVNKVLFYRMLKEMRLPHPKTYFPGSLAELVSLGKRLPYPYIIKPAFSISFQREFGRKVFQVKSSRDLDMAADKLRDKNLEVMIQEIIPGRETYSVLIYFNKLSEPLAMCGWDKIRQYPLDFGFGTFCKSSWRPTAAEDSLRLLRTIGYYGFAGVEVKKDPGDCEYKIIEINARTTLQNALAGACGADIGYIAYLDAGGRVAEYSTSFRSNVLWADDFLDTISFLSYLARRDISKREIVDSLHPVKVRSVAAWDDPLPLAFRFLDIMRRAFRRILSKLNPRSASKA